MPNFRNYDTVKNWMLNAAQDLVPKENLSSYKADSSSDNELVSKVKINPDSVNTNLLNELVTLYKK